MTFRDWLEMTSTACVAGFARPMLPVIRRKWPKKQLLEMSTIADSRNVFEKLSNALYKAQRMIFDLLFVDQKVRKSSKFNLLDADDRIFGRPGHFFHKQLGSFTTCSICKGDIVPREIGRGNDGIVFSIGDKVFKVTENSNEASLSNKLKNVAELLIIDVFDLSWYRKGIWGILQHAGVRPENMPPEFITAANKMRDFLYKRVQFNPQILADKLSNINAFVEFIAANVQADETWIRILAEKLYQIYKHSGKVLIDPASRNWLSRSGKMDDITPVDFGDSI